MRVNSWLTLFSLLSLELVWREGGTRLLTKLLARIILCPLRLISYPALCVFVFLFLSLRIVWKEAVHKEIAECLMRFDSRPAPFSLLDDNIW